MATMASNLLSAFHFAFFCLLSYSPLAWAATGSFFQFQGLSYTTSVSNISSTTDWNGTFQYESGDIITFSVGSLTLGSAKAQALMSVANFIPGFNGSYAILTDPTAANLARFLYSLDNDTTAENNINIESNLLPIINQYASRINFNQSTDAFGADNNTLSLFAQLNHTLADIPTARNYVRRSMLGIKKYRNVEIPIEDNTTPYVLGDVYTPIGGGKYPPIVNLGAYGKKMLFGCICNSSDLVAAEDYEDSYFIDPAAALAQQTGKAPPAKRIPEFRETLNTHDWVPRGYVKVLIDGPGVCNTPGHFNQFSLEESHAFRDSIEWAANQSWSNGNVGIQGVSYWSMVTMNVAALRPASLKAAIPLFNDEDSYRDYVYNGALYNEFNAASAVQCPGVSSSLFDFSISAPDISFDYPEIFGPTGNQTISPNISNIDIPMWIAGPQEHPGIHVRGSSESYIHINVPYKRYTLVDGDIFGWPYDPDVVDRQILFMDYWLKDEKSNGALDEPQVELMMRIGNHSYEWTQYDSWPINDTEYMKLWLSAERSTSLSSDPTGKPLYILSFDEATTSSNVTYSADLLNSTQECNTPGVAFVTDPLTANLTLAGYMQLVTYVSSTSDDADLVVSVTVLQSNGTKISYAIYTGYGDVPPGYGWGKVSHRKLDMEKTTEYRPYMTNLQQDYEPLSAGEIVEVIVEIWPGTAHITAGSRIRLDIQPQDMCESPAPHDFNATYHTGAFNTIYTGPKYASYLQVPSVPLILLSNSTSSNTTSTAAGATATATTFTGGASQLKHGLYIAVMVTILAQYLLV